MRQIFKRVGKSTLSIILCVMMVFSTMLIGTVTVGAATLTSDGNAILFFNMTGETWWIENSGGANFAYFFNSSSNASLFSTKAIQYSGNIYYVKIPAGTWDHVILTRNSVTSGASWDNKYNQTGDITLSATQNYISDFAENSASASWSTVKPTSSVKVTATPDSNVKVGDSVTLKPSLTNYTTYNTIKSTSYSSVKLNGATATSGTDYTISGNTFVPNKSGEFTITASITYNAKGYTNLETTTTANTTLTVVVSEVSDISAVAKYSDDGATYTTGNEGGTVTIGATDNVGSTGTTVTATPKDGYKFVGWSSSGSGSFADSTSANTTYYPVADGEVATASFVKTYAVSYNTSSNATITVTNAKGTDLSETLAGDTVTVTVTPNANYKCTGITVTAENGTEVTPTGSGTSWSFTMPASNVSVSATIVAKSQYTVTAKSNNTSMGTVSPATSTVYEGDTVTLTATPKSDCTFSNWTLTGDYTIVSGYATTDTTLKITVNGAVTATATFQEDPGVEVANRYLVWSTSDAYTSLTNYMPIYRMSNGEYIAKFSDSVDIEPNTNYFFALSSTQDYNGMFWQNNTDAITVTTNDENLISFEKKENGQKYFGRFSFSSSEVTDIEICVGTNSNDGLNNIVGTNYDVRVISNVPDGAIKIWAKDGSTVEGGTNKYGETTITSGTLEGSTVADAGTYRTYYAPKEGGIITIQTQITNPSSGYYVYAYVINGQTVTTTSKGSGVYESTYSVPEDYEGTIEITPVYFNTKIEEAGDYITFYVNASEVSELWGNTVACYSYYYYDEANKKAYSGEGAYPGQPMLLNANGKYFTKLARYYYDETGTKTKYQISGITINNFYEYDIHKNLLTGDSAKNHQTYDYNDFKFLSDPALNYDTIQFDIKYRTSTTNQSTLDNGNAGAVDNDSITISKFTRQNGWDDFVDYDGNLIDIQGNSVANKENKIYIVSTGNQDTSVGTWSTVWYVYDANGKYITQGNPSDFIPRSNPEENTEAYNTMTQYAGYYTQICFESYMDASTSTDSDNSGKRVDGRWYYKNSQDSEVTVDVNVQYSDDNGSSWSVGSDGKKGVATIDGVTEITYPQANIEAALNAIAGDGYMFVEWGTVDDDGNNYKTVSTKVTDKFFVDTNYHLVARFIKVDDHELVISHEKYAGPDAVGGYGFYYASATLTHKNGTTTEYPQTQDAFKVPLNYITDDTLEITLTTVCSGDNTFMYWYQYVDGEYQIIEPEEDVYGKKGTVSYTFEMNVADLYKDANTLVVQALNFYSDIARVTADAVLNYKYYNRFGEEKTYTKKITLDDWYIDKNGYTLTDPLIYENAPAIDDLYKDCKWTITDQTVTKNATTATLWATQPDKTYDVKFVETVNGDKITKQSATVYLNDYIAVDQNGAIYGSKDDPENIKFFEAAQKSTSGDDFAYWLVTDTDTGKEVAKCYYYQFNLRIVGNYTIEAVYNDEATSITISDPTYTREQFTDSEGKVVTDYLYVDFIVAYMESNGVLLNSAGDNYKTGLVVEFDKDVKVNVKDAVGGKLTDDAKANATFDSDAATIKDFILTGDDKKVYDTDDADSDVNRALYNFAIDNTKYNNKNRLDFYVRYDNTPNIRQYAMKAYYYVYQVDANGNLVEGTYNITAPVYFYFYEIGNSKSVTSTPTALTVSS